MNRLKYNQIGGVPMNADDLQWQFDEIYKGIGHLASTFINQPSFKLSGIEYADDAVSAGILYHEGEIYLHPAIPEIIIPSGHVLVLEIVTEDDPTSDAVFADDQVRALKQLRYARTITVPSAEEENYIPFYIRRWTGTNWQRLPVKDTNGNTPSIYESEGMYARVTADGFVHLRGDLHTGPGNYLHCLPEELLPHADDLTYIFRGLLAYLHTDDNVITQAHRITGIQMTGHQKGGILVPSFNQSTPGLLSVPEFSFKSAYTGIGSYSNIWIERSFL